MRTSPRVSCVIKGCYRDAVHGLFGTTAVLCDKHKHPNTVDMSQSKCVVDGCKYRPKYYGNNLYWTHCLKHRLKGMYTLVLKEMYFIDKDGKCCESPDSLFEHLSGDFAELKRRTRQWHLDIENKSKEIDRQINSFDGIFKDMLLFNKHIEEAIHDYL